MHVLTRPFAIEPVTGILQTEYLCRDRLVTLIEESIADMRSRF